MSEAENLEPLSELGDYIAEALGESIESWNISFDELNVALKPADIVEAMRFLRDDDQTGFVSFVDLCGVDYPEREQRFEVVYHLMSPKYNTRIRARVCTDEETPVPSLTGIYPGAEWFEREAYDMYGILFTGHPDLRRLLTDYGFDGHPLRKDFPLTGHVETRYNDELKRVVYEPVELRQEFRNFDFLSPWEGSHYDLPNEGVGSEKGSD
ncbi:MAG: NADH-quinone oxidoreductase subunit C [Hyphomicrobiales bacterium]|nr:NADH-quinone oxidoreductase subunit C [Hyphomicrobiales bacterium]